MAFNEWTHPDLFTRIRVAGEQFANHAEFVTGRTVNQQYLAGFLVFYQRWCAGHGVARFVVTKTLLPDALTGFLVQGDDAGVQRTEENLVAVDRRTTVDHVTAWANAFWQTGGIAPLALARLGVDGEHTGVGTGDVNGTVMNQRLAFLTTLFFITERERPGRCQLVNVLVVDGGQRAVTLGFRANAVTQNVFWCFGVVDNVIPADGAGFGDGGFGRKSQSQSQCGKAYALTER